jgi:epoxyqueuosine reductase QueG
VPKDAEPHISLLDWLRADDVELATRYDRLFVPRNDTRWLKRNALIAAGNVGGKEERAAVEPYLDSDDDVLREHASWALAHMEARA